MKKKILILSLATIVSFSLLAPKVEALSVIDDLKSKVQQAIDNPFDYASVRVNGLRALKALVDDLLVKVGNLEQIQTDLKGLVDDLLVRVTALEGGEVDFTYPDEPAEWATFNIDLPGVWGGNITLKSLEEDFCCHNSCEMKPDAEIWADYSKGTLYFSGGEGNYLSQFLTENDFPESGEVISGEASFFWFGQKVTGVPFEITMP